ncbi:MAG: hypothetical protein HY808_04865 [Nitrospirae bacterium]|nr:hypothetical protein [Nitrospirota bacterium]
MCAQDIKEIVVEFDGEDLSKYGLFPVFTWYLTDVIHLPEYFAQVSVNRKRNHKRAKKGKKPEYTDVQICSLRSAVYFVNRHGIGSHLRLWHWLYQIDDALKTEPQVAIL